MDRSPLGRVLLVSVAVSLFAPLSSPPEPRQPVTQVAAASDVGPSRRPLARPGELIVSSAARGAGRGLQRAVARVDGSAPLALGGGLALVRVPPGHERAAAARLEADPAVAYAEPNYIRTAQSHDGSEITWGVGSTGAPELWERPTPVTGAGVRVAVLDSGVQATHPQLRGRVARRFDAFNGNGNDDCGHGTAVAGVVAATHDGSSSVGVAPDATIVPVRVLRFDEFYGLCGGDDAAIIRGIRWAADPHNGNADIINMSLSGPQRSRALRDAVAYAASQGVLVVAASGNTGDRTVNYPAAYPGVVSVGGIERSGGDLKLWRPTSFGSVDIAAPAKRIRVLLADAIRDEPWRVGRACPGGAGWCADGTSFAAPHVAGVAALLHAQHPELQTMSPRARVRRLRQWLLATAPRVPGRPGGVDVKTGHGRVGALEAADASTDPSRLLLAWDAGRRVFAPTRRMVTTPARLTMKAVATTGTGEPVQGQEVVFTPPAGAGVSTTRTPTNSAGVAATTVRSAQGSRVARYRVTLGDRTLAIDTYVLDHDDNTPGVRAPATSFRDSLNLALDIDDVYRFRLRKSETLRANVSGVRRGREQVLLYLHRGSTRDVTNPYRAPLEEDPGFASPHRLSRTVSTDGVRYLDAFGFGTYRLRWRILSPAAIRSLTASPATFSPDGDGQRDRTTLSWRVARRGSVVLRIVNGAGAVVRRVDYGSVARGGQRFSWSGRNNRGRAVGGGVYRASLRWSDGRGRMTTEATAVTLRR